MQQTRVINKQRKADLLILLHKLAVDSISFKVEARSYGWVISWHQIQPFECQNVQNKHSLRV